MGHLRLDCMRWFMSHGEEAFLNVLPLDIMVYFVWVWFFLGSRAVRG